MNDVFEPLLLDTHYWLWLESGREEAFSKNGLAAVREAGARSALLISVMSVWEVAMLEAKGRVQLTMPCEDWVARVLSPPGATLAPLTPEIAIDSTRLPGPIHGDPTDRIILATALRLGATLMTRDKNLLDYGRRHHMRVMRG